MSIKFKRNLPILVFLVVFLFFLVVSWGNQHVSAYSVNITFSTDPLSASQNLETNPINQTTETGGSINDDIFNQ